MFGALPIALVTAVGIASPAMAKGGGGTGGGGRGGGGTGGGGCATTPVANPCASATAFAQLPETTFTYTFDPQAAAPSSPQTITFSVTRVNGQLQDSRTTTAAEIIASAQPGA
jgi:hypothetical protein